MRNDILEYKEQILQWIKEKRTKGFICQELKCKPETLNRYLDIMGINYSGQSGIHPEGYQSGYKTAEEYIQSGSIIKSHRLKQKLIRDGIKDDKCELCGACEWFGVQLPLELHHKDGNHFNNELDNLMILCPNCHSIQEGNSGANVGRYSKQQDNEAVQPTIQNYCIDCNQPISRNACRCKSCASKEREKDKSNKPDRETLKQLIRSTAFTQIGTMFNVSDNAVRKWCDSYDLPRRVKDIKDYSDEEWDKI